MRAKWFSTRTLHSTQSSPITRASSAPSLGRCRPVATRTTISERGIPAASRSAIIGRRKSPFGTGRVMSQTRMHAEPHPSASFRSGAAATGSTSAAATAFPGSPSTGMVGLRTTVTSQSAGKRTGRASRP